MGTPPTRSRHERGYDARHVATRERLLRSHVDGSPCWWDGRPMFRDPEANWDGEPLHADHSNKRAAEGGDADRFLHAQCNRQRGDGSRDHLRPILVGGDFQPPKADDKPYIDEKAALGTRFMDWPDFDERA